MIIYLITNTINGKKYVGQHCGTKDARWKQHLKAALDLKNEKPLYRAMRKHGAKNFRYEVLEELGKDADEKLLDEREKFFIKEYNTFVGNNQGYNLTYGGDGQIGAFCREQTKEKLSQKLDKNNYAVYNPETGKLIEIFDKLKDASKKYGIRNSGWIPTTAKKNNLNNGKYSVLGGFVWLSKPNGEKFPKSILPVGKKFVRKNLGMKKERDTEISQYALSGLLVNTWPDNLRDISDSLSIPYSSLLKSVKDLRRITGGYFWRRFPKGQSPDEIEEKMEKHVITFSKRQLTNYPIIKFVQGREARKYPSVMDAILDSNMAPTKILDSLEFGKEDDFGNEWKWVQRPNYIRHSIKEYYLRD